MDWHTKVKILRQYETYCYQICYYLLQHEAHAYRVAETALLNVAADAWFFTDSDEARKEKILRASIRTSLLRHRESDVI